MYCSIPDQLLKFLHTARWIQDKFGKKDGPCHKHDIRGNNPLSNERFRADMHNVIREMDRVELERLAFDVVEDVYGAVKFYDELPWHRKFLLTRILTFYRSV